MLKNKLYILILLFFGLNQVNAETTYGFCNLQDDPNGENIAELEAEVYLMALPYNKIYSKVLIECWVFNRDLYDGIRINKKAKFYNHKGVKIGKCVLDFNPLRFVSQNDSSCLVQIEGYIHNSSINPQSVPENDLSNLLISASINAKLAYFEKHILEFNYKENQEENDYTSYIVFEPNFVRQTLHPRILMVFYKNELIAIFHTRPIKVKYYDSIEMGNEYKMIYNSKFTEHTKTQMMSIYKKKLNSL